MTVLLTSLGAALATHLLVGARRWPWRVADLDCVLDRDDEPGSREVVGSARRSDRAPVPLRARVRERRTGRIEPPPDLVACLDLFFVAATAGLTIVGSMAVIAAARTGATSEAFDVAVTEIRRGGSTAAALDGVVDALGPSIQPMISVLASAASSGTPVAGATQRLADIERSRVRRRMEVRARRLPVLMLIPLVGLVLPAFAVLTVVPVVIALADGFPG